MIENQTTERMAQLLHDWYLEAIKDLDSSHYNLAAKKPYTELSEQQKDIDRYIARKIIEIFGLEQ